MLTRSLNALPTLLALVALLAVFPSTARAQGCQSCLQIENAPDACDFCSAGKLCYGDCKHDVLGNCYVAGENCPAAFAAGTFLEGAQPGEAFRLAGGTVLPLSEEISVHVNCTGEILGVLQESAMGPSYLERDKFDPQWVRKQEARLGMVSWLL